MPGGGEGGGGGVGNEPSLEGGGGEDGFCSSVLFVLAFLGDLLRDFLLSASESDPEPLPLPLNSETHKKYMS